MLNKERTKALEEEAKSFLNKVRLSSQLGGSNSMFLSFLTLFSKYQNKLICANEVYNCLKYDLFAHHPNLLKEFKGLYMRETSKGINPNSYISYRHKIKIDAKRSHPTVTREVLEVKQNQCNIQDAKEVVSNLLKENVKKLKIKYPMTRGFKTCTPSYQLLLEEDDPVSASTEGSEIEDLVLNNCVKLVAPNSSFRPTIRGKAGEALDGIEDELYMQDLFLEHLKSAAMNVEVLLNMLETDDQLALTTWPDAIKDHLTAQNLTCIENLYGELGLGMIGALHLNPRTALDAISLRLKQKLRTLGFN